MLFILLLQLCTVWLGNSQGKTLLGDDAISWDEEKDVSSDEIVLPVAYNHNPFSFNGKREARLPPQARKQPGYGDPYGKRK